MNNRIIEPPIVSLSVRVYQILLMAYPSRFRREYGQHMLQVFRDCCLQAFHQNGADGMLMLWAFTFLDFLRSVFEQHLQKETYMTKSKFIKLSPWAFILGSLTFIPLLGTSDAITFWSSILGTILLAIGLLGLRVRYAESSGKFGKTILLVGVIGIGLLPLSIGILAILSLLFQIGGQDFMNQGGWILLFIGPVIPLLALALFGVSALVNRPMERFNWLPFVTGIWYPAIYLIGSIVTLTHNGAYEGEFGTPLSIMIVMQFLSLCLFGADLILEKESKLSIVNIEGSVREGSGAGR